MASGYSSGSGGAVTDWHAFETWARSVEGAEVETRIERGLDDAASAHHPHAPGYAPIEVLVALVGAIDARLPDAWRMRVARFCGRASRALREGGCSVDARGLARELMERPLRELLGLVRAARQRLEVAA